MRVSVDEPRQQNAMAGVDHFTIRSDQFFNLAPAAGGYDAIAAHKQPAIFNDGQLAQVAASARPVGARQRDDL